MVNRIAGAWDDAAWYGRVTFDGRPVEPTRSQRLRNHSPDGFAWGYGGSGPSQLALAILLEAGASDEDALNFYQDFKRTYLEPVANDAPLALDVDVLAWLRDRDDRFWKRLSE